jgi:hypothetical protein
MGRGQTKAELEERNEALSRENAALTLITAWREMQRQPDATETVDSGDGRIIRFELWGATRANGGFLLIVERDQSWADPPLWVIPMITVGDFDSLASRLRANTLPETLDVRAAVSRLEARRNELFMACVRPLGEGV